MDLNTVEAVLTGNASLPGDAGRAGDAGPTVDMAPTGWRVGDAFLAGGTWLFSEPQPTVRRLRDLTTLGWPALTESADGLRIGATCTLAELAAYQPPGSWPAGVLIGQCCDALLGSFKVWNAATVGGNLCLSLPAGPMTSLATALDGALALWGADGSTRTVRAMDFVEGDRRNVLSPGELLREVLLPAAALHDRTAFRSFSLSNGGRSAGVVIGRARHDGMTVLTVTASTVRPVQLRFDSPPTAAEVTDALREAGPTWHDDVHGHPLWRRDLTAGYLDQVRAELAA